MRSHTAFGEDIVGNKPKGGEKMARLFGGNFCDVKGFGVSVEDHVVEDGDRPITVLGVLVCGIVPIRDAAPRPVD